MTTIPVSLRRSVIQRADNRCEYCGISQVGQVATFHIDHIIPVVAGGETTSDNLALACGNDAGNPSRRRIAGSSSTGLASPKLPTARYRRVLRTRYAIAEMKEFTLTGLCVVPKTSEV